MSILLTTTSASAQNWTTQTNLKAGDQLDVECWGAGSGGSRGTSNGAGGGGGAYASSNYVLTPNDVAVAQGGTGSGVISYILQAGSAGVGAANSAVGPDTSFSTNNLNIQPNTTNIGTVVGTIGSGGALPTGINGTNTGWFTNHDAGLQEAIVAFGTTSDGFPYTDYRIWGTTTGASTNTVTFGFGAIGAAVSATGSLYHQLVGGSTTNISGSSAEIWCASTTTNPLSTIATTAFTPGGALTRMSFTGTTVASTTVASVRTFLQTSGAAAIDITIRYAGIQLEAAGSVTFYKSTPGYCLAKGGRATSGTTGGGGGLASACVPTNALYTGAVAFNGGAGATNAQGGGGGGAAGPDGAGGASTSTVGGTGDNGNVTGSGTSNVLGGSGGLGSTTSETAGGAPGGGGGGQTTGTSGTGSAGGRGQVKLTVFIMMSGSFNAAASISGDATRSAAPGGATSYTAAAEVDAAASISSFANTKGIVSGEIDAIAGISANAIRLRYAAGETDASAGISGYAAIVGNNYAAKTDATASDTSRATLLEVLRGQVDAAAGVAGDATIRTTLAQAAGEIDGVASFYGAIFVRAAVAGQIGAVATDALGVPVLLAASGGEIDATAGSATRTSISAALGGAYLGAAGEVANPFRVTYALAQTDAAAGISAYARQWWNNTAGRTDAIASIGTGLVNLKLVLRGESDAAADIQARLAGATRWFVAAELDASASVSSAPLFGFALRGAILGAASAAATPYILVASGGQLGAAAGIASTIAPVTIGAQLDAQAAVFGGVVLRVNAAGGVDGAAAVNAVGNVVALSGGQLDATGQISVLLGNNVYVAGEVDATALLAGDFSLSHQFVLGGNFDASGGMFLGWQQFVDDGSRLPPKAHGVAVGHRGRGARLPAKQRGRAA